MKTARFASLLALALSLPLVATAAVPPTIAFSARVADGGQPVNGTASFKFTLWKVATGGTAGTDDVWNETQASVPVTNGVVSTTLGDIVANPPPDGNALPLFDASTPLWLEVTMTIGSTTSTFSPRMAIQSVPYALSAPFSCYDQTNTVTVGANLSTFTTSGDCAAGYVVTGGGYNMVGVSQNWWLWQTSQNGNGWLVRAFNANAAGSASLTVYARCCRAQ